MSPDEDAAGHHAGHHYLVTTPWILCFKKLLPERLFHKSLLGFQVSIILQIMTSWYLVIGGSKIYLGSNITIIEIGSYGVLVSSLLFYSNTSDKAFD